MYTLAHSVAARNSVAKTRDAQYQTYISLILLCNLAPLKLVL